MAVRARRDAGSPRAAVPHDAEPPERAGVHRRPGLVLTHGHEDHVGAVPYLLRQRSDIPIFGSRLTLALVAEKIKEHRLSGTQPRPVAEGA